MCDDQDVPFVFALGRRALGRACAKLVPVSVVGIFNYEGAEVRHGAPAQPAWPGQLFHIQYCSSHTYKLHKLVTF